MTTERTARNPASEPKGRPTPTRRDTDARRGDRSATLQWIAVAVAVGALLVGAAVIADGDGRGGGRSPVVVHGG